MVPGDRLWSPGRGPRAASFLICEGITKCAALTGFLPNLMWFPSPGGPLGSNVQLRAEKKAPGRCPPRRSRTMSRPRTAAETPAVTALAAAAEPPAVTTPHRGKTDRCHNPAPRPSRPMPPPRTPPGRAAAPDFRGPLSSNRSRRPRRTSGPRRRTNGRPRRSARRGGRPHCDRPRGGRRCFRRPNRPPTSCRTPRTPTSARPIAGSCAGAGRPGRSRTPTAPARRSRPQWRCSSPTVPMSPDPRGPAWKGDAPGRPTPKHT